MMNFINNVKEISHSDKRFLKSKDNIHLNLFPRIFIGKSNGLKLLFINDLISFEMDMIFKLKGGKLRL